MNIDTTRYGIGFMIGIFAGVMFAMFLTAKLMQIPPGMPAPVHVQMTIKGNTSDYSCQSLNMPEPKEQK